MGLLDELDRLTSSRSIAGPSSSNREGVTNAQHQKDRRSVSHEKSIAQVISDHSEDDEESIVQVVLDQSEDEGAVNPTQIGNRLQNAHPATRQPEAVKQAQVGDTASLFSSDVDVDVNETQDESSDDEPIANQSKANKTAALGRIPKGGAFEANLPAGISQQLHDAIMSDEDLYRRILLFEPIPLEEVSALAKKAGVQGLRSKEILRNWLDVQCICFYSGELTGQRYRY